MPKVSFILPAYKSQFLREAIASILAQTYRDFELIVVDDCSPQGLKSIVDEFNDPRLTYNRNETNIGGKDLVAAWNKALSYAKGEWVVCASDDDVYHLEYLQEMMSLAERYPSVDAFHCHIVVIDSCGDWRRMGAPRAEYEIGLEMLYYRGVLRVDSQRIGDFMYRASVLRSIGGYVNTRRAWCSDAATAIAMSLKNGVCCSGRTLYYWRSSGANISSQTGDYADKLMSCREFYDWLKKTVDSVLAKNEFEGRLLQLIKRDFASGMYGAFNGVLGRLPLLKWIDGIRSNSVPAELRWRLVVQRLRARLRPVWS